MREGCRFFYDERDSWIRSEVLVVSIVFCVSKPGGGGGGGASARADFNF